MTAETPPTSGLVAGKYILDRMIGRGGMGSVWEARHASLGTRFAIKFIEAEYADSQEARSRFDKEARAASRIQSKHAIQIYDHGVTEDGKPYIVMELLQGEPLDKRIDRVGRMSLQETAKIIGQVSRGLARAHESGIIHRDLKPENIFLVRTPDDDDEVAKVLDFGIAKDQGANNPNVTSSTKTGAVLGTPFYMSPEQARGLRSVDHRTDLWSLGVIAFKCVTGRLPFDGESVGDLLVKICTAPVPVPSQLAPGLPPGFDAWFARALEREPDRRFGTAAELSDALAFAAGIVARGPGSFQIPSSGSPPMSALSTMANGAGSQQTPQRMTPAPVAATVDDPYRAGPPIGAMTANGLSSSQSIPGVGRGGPAKYIVFAALAGLGLAAAGTVVFVKFLKPGGPTNTNTIAIATPSTSADPSAAPLKLDPSPPPLDSATANRDPATNPSAKKPATGAKPPPVTSAGVGAVAVKPPPGPDKPPGPGPIVYTAPGSTPSAKPSAIAPKPPVKPDPIGY